MEYILLYLVTAAWCIIITIAWDAKLFDQETNRNMPPWWITLMQTYSWPVLWATCMLVFLPGTRPFRKLVRFFGKK